MVDAESLLYGIGVGVIITTFSVFLQEWRSRKILRIQLNHDDRRKAYLRLWDIHDEYKRKHEVSKKHGMPEKNWVSEVKNLLDSPDGIFLENIKLKLENKIETIRKKAKENYEKKIKPIEETMEEIRRQMPEEEFWEEEDARVKSFVDEFELVDETETMEERRLRTDLVGLAMKIMDVKYKFNEKVEKEILVDVPDLIKKHMRELK